jgi:segregation and condensation protein A
VYRVKLQQFEGPLDLLLFFIKRDELNIYDIPIAHITHEFLEYVHLMRELDLDIAGEFIVVAATLMQIKVRMLLPQQEGEEPEEDPRAELVRRLIEYKRFKEMSEEISRREDEQRKVQYRKFFHADPTVHDSDEHQETLKDITLFNLIAAFKRAMDRMPKRVVHEVALQNVSVDEQMSFTLDYLRVHKETTLLRLVSHMTDKVRVIVTIIALLEMAKNKVISLSPADGQDDVVIRGASPTIPIAARPA